MLLVSTSTLLLIAGVFWLVAGANVVAVGIQAYIAVEAAAPILVSLAMGSIATFLAFFYVGLGMALALTGVLFIVGWRKASGR